MATYIPGITDYIPQFQPFQPDYNFLGNVLQNAQSKYDSNYKALSKTYGTLLDSPMLREDNIKQREEYFKMIDDDIKKMSGMDLSLQQNVDAANKVFQSFYKNKNMVHDMVFTKEYQNQLQIANNYKNCIDQEKCGGKYWDTGVNALHYRADEFKKASKESSMLMNPGEFTPYINIQEKATKYAQDLFGKSSGAFGVQTVTKTPDGRYQVTLKNGEALAVPLKQLLINQYTKDPAIQKMFQTQAYVQRKSFIQQNAAKFGSEDAAEDEYFKIADYHAQMSKLSAEEMQDLKNSTEARKNILQKEIEKNGTYEDSILSKAFGTAAMSDAIASDSMEYYDQVVKTANSLYEAGDDREAKRQRADAVIMDSTMRKDISDSALTIAAMTHQESVAVDPYAKSAYDFGLAMKKMEFQYDLMDRNAQRKAMYDIEKSVWIEQYKKGGGGFGVTDEAFVIEGVPGTASGEDKTNEFLDTADKILESAKNVKTNETKFVTGYGNTLMDIIKGGGESAEDKLLAKQAMIAIFGSAKLDKEGNVIKPGYDSNRGVLVDSQGNVHTETSTYVTPQMSNDLYGKAVTQKDENIAIPSQAVFLKNEGAAFVKAHDEQKKLFDMNTEVWLKNNKVVKAAGQYTDQYDKMAWESYFTDSNNLRNKLKFAEEYSKKYKATHSGTEPSLSHIEDKWKKVNEDYNKIYNSSPKGFEAINGNPELGMAGGGKASGALVSTFDGTKPGLYGTQGLLSFQRDGEQNGAIYATGNHATLESAFANSQEHGSNARMAIETLVNMIKSGAISKKEADTYGKVIYMDVAGGDPTKAGMIVKFSPKFIEKYKAKKDQPATWADDPTLLSHGATMLIDKNKAKNSFTESMRTQFYDQYLNHKSVTIRNEAGEVTINKRKADGTIIVQGNLYGYKAGDVDKNGNPVLRPTPVSYPYDNNPGGQKVYDAVYNTMKEIAKANEDYKLGNSKKIYNVHDFKDVKNLVDDINYQDANQSNILTNAFLSRVQFNTK